MTSQEAEEESLRKSKEEESPRKLKEEESSRKLKEEESPKKRKVRCYPTSPERAELVPSIKIQTGVRQVHGIEHLLFETVPESPSTEPNERRTNGLLRLHPSEKRESNDSEITIGRRRRNGRRKKADGR